MSDRERAAIEAVAKAIWGRARLDKGKPWDDFLEDARQAIAAYNAALQEPQEDDSPEYDDLDERTAAAIAAASDHYRRVGLQPTGTIVAGRVSDILGGRTPAAPEHIPAEEER